MTIVKEANRPPKAAIIWLHGLGASADDLVMVCTMLSLDESPIRHVFLQAPDRAVTINQGMQMPAWYDIRSQCIGDDEDEEGILGSCATLKEEIARQESQGILRENIFLAGFSQGGVIALSTALMASERLGGVIVLSGYLALKDKILAMNLDDKVSLPIFISLGNYDPIIPATWVEASVELLAEKGLSAITCLLFDREHSVCAKELGLLREWLLEKLISRL